MRLDQVHYDLLEAGREGWVDEDQLPAPCRRLPQPGQRVAEMDVEIGPETLRAGAQGLQAAVARWGLTPAWLKDLSKTPAHARAETLAEQPMFRRSIR